VSDADAVTERARAASGVVEREPADSPYGRMATVRDPFGHRWMFSGPAQAARRGASGDVGYFALWVEDVDRAAQFYAAVLGWDFVTEGPTRRRATNAPYRTELTALAEMRSAAWPDRATPTAFCARQVEDLDAAADRIRAAGGRTQPRRHGILDCADDQGLPFSIFDDGETYPSGDLAYLTVEVPSIEAAVRFHERVFDWTFRPGSHPDGRQVDGPTEPVIVPMFAVDDITAAVERVRGAGGTASDPQRYPYGTTSDCVDDQGLRFYLGELD
jgi:predicted enzyme related to lactoylglutathione lyase